MMINERCLQPKTQFSASTKKTTAAGKPESLSPKESERQSAIKQLQTKAAQNWGVSISDQTANPDVFRQNLQMAFYEQYFQWLATSLANVDIEYRRPGYLNECISDVNMAEDDFCIGDPLLHYTLPETIVDTVNFKQALGYEDTDEKQWENDYQNCLKAVAKKLGMTQANPTEFDVFATMEVMPAKELKQRFKNTKKKSDRLNAPTPQPPVIKIMTKKAIFSKKYS
jgi:hypothetical protein